jgi:hypothetical protein
LKLGVEKEKKRKGQTKVRRTDRELGMRKGTKKKGKVTTGSEDP